ncbi:hypothetical protein LCGC14_0843250 [marine sediment metagenome]|uniref:Uncharacterized protein n=1 Tax=marine sediment metagenome TaxID=412755 RepID=A0A0F9SJM3_9ZZZZ
MAEDKPDAAQAAADAELTQLAASIVGEEVPAIIEGKDSVSPQDKPTSEGEKPAPKDGETPTSKGEKPEGEGGEKPKEGGDGGGQEDPLKDLATDKGALKVLLEHPDLGPILNRWADNLAIAQVSSALERERPTIEADTKRSEAERVEDEHFSSMTPEQVSEEISGDEGKATAYARYQQRKQAGGAPNAEAIAQTAQLYAYTSEVAAVRGMLEGSELTDEVKESLKPEHFTHLKTEGIKEWKKAVFQAIVTHEAAGMAEKLKEDGWEAYKEEHLAEVDGERPALVSGRREGPTPDLIKTDSGVLLEGALSGKSKKGK